MNNVKEKETEFLETVASYVQYWNSFEDKTSEEKLTGLAFSILSYLDGCNGNCYVLIPYGNLNLKGNISGDLHENFYAIYNQIVSSNKENKC